MQSIETRYLGPTNTKGARIRATASGGDTLLVSYPHEAQHPEDAHALAADALRGKLGWPEMFLAGSSARGYVFVFPPMEGRSVWIGRRA